MLAIEQCSTGFASFSLAQEKVCKTCLETKPLSEFVISRKITSANGKTHSYKDGRKNICKPCQRARNAEWQKMNPGYWAERRRAIKEQRGAENDIKQSS